MPPGVKRCQNITPATWAQPHDTVAIRETHIRLLAGISTSQITHINRRPCRV